MRPSKIDLQTRYLANTDADLADFKWPFSGIGSFAHLSHSKCLTDPSVDYDIAIVGAPFDTAVSFRPGSHAQDIQDAIGET